MREDICRERVWCGGKMEIMMEEDGDLDYDSDEAMVRT